MTMPIDQHLDNAVPVLDSLGLKATFYVTAFSQSMQARLNEWKKLATKGMNWVIILYIIPVLVVREENG
jgi:peptidoglycan/xylan/chitin deacetylase (PgdA/CDA1 family)